MNSLKTKKRDYIGMSYWRILNDLIWGIVKTFIDIYLESNLGVGLFEVK